MRYSALFCVRSGLWEQIGRYFALFRVIGGGGRGLGGVGGVLVGGSGGVRGGLGLGYGT